MGQTGLAGVCEIFHCTNYLEQISKSSVRIHSSFISIQCWRREDRFLFYKYCVLKSQKGEGRGQGRGEGGWEGRRRRSKANGTWMASCFNLGGRIMEFKNLLLICVTLQKREKKNAPLKNNKAKSDTFIFLKFSYLLPFPYVTRKEDSVSFFLHHSEEDGSLCGYVVFQYTSRTPRCYLAWNCFSSRKHLLIKNSECVELKLISLFKSK